MSDNGKRKLVLRLTAEGKDCSDIQWALHMNFAEYQQYLKDHPAIDKELGRIRHQLELDKHFLWREIL